jgi:hypothetical protein
MVQTQSSFSFSLQTFKSLSKTSISSQNLGHPPLFSKCSIYISKLGFVNFFLQQDQNKITHLQTMGILPSLSTKQSFLNMIHTRSQISKLGAFSLVCQWVKISSQEHVSISTPNNIDLQSHPNFSKISLLFHHFVDSGKLSITSSF